MRLRFFGVLGVCFVTSVLTSAASGQTTAPAKPAPRPTVTRSVQPVPTPEPAKPKAFTNDDVLTLKAAGFSDDEIVGAIQVAQNKSFDVSGDGLKALKDTGVSKRVMAAILGIRYTPEVVAAPATPPTTNVTKPEASQAKAATPPTTLSTGTTNDSKGSKFGFIRKVPGLGKKNGTGASSEKRAANTNATAPADTAVADTPGDTTLLLTPKRGEPVKFVVSLSTSDACIKARQYLIVNDAELESSNCAVGQLRTRPVNKKGWVVDGARRAVVDFVETTAGTEVRVRVMAKGSVDDAKESVRLATHLKQLLLI